MPREITRIPGWNSAVLDIPLVGTSLLWLKEFILLNVAIPCIYLSVTECSKVDLLRSGGTRWKQTMWREAGFRNGKTQAAARHCKAERRGEVGTGKAPATCCPGRTGAGGLRLFKLLQGPMQGTHRRKPGSRHLQMSFLNGHGCPFPNYHSDRSSSKSQLHMTSCLSMEPVFQAICT